MTALLTVDQASYRLGIGKTAVHSAIDRGDLIQVEMEGVRGSVRKYVTAASVDAWIAKLNGESADTSQDAEDVVAALQRYVFGLSCDLKTLTDKVDLALEKMVGQAGQKERDRKARLRHTVSSRIGDAFDPHGYYVYLLWGDDDETPLYIGQSRNVLSRLGSHMTNKDRRYLVRSVQVIKCSGAATMNRTEAALIREYNPPLNTAGCVARVSAVTDDVA